MHLHSISIPPHFYSPPPPSLPSLPRLGCISKGKSISYLVRTGWASPPGADEPERYLLVGLKVLHEDVETLGVLAVVLHDRHRALDHLAGVAFSVNLAEAAPLPELGVLGDLNDVDVVLAGERLDELLVVVLVAVLGQDDELAVAALDGLAALVEAAGQLVVRQGLLQHHLQGRHQVHGLAGGGGLHLGGSLNLAVRHRVKKRSSVRKLSCLARLSSHSPLPSPPLSGLHLGGSLN